MDISQVMYLNSVPETISDISLLIMEVQQTDTFIAYMILNIVA